jgi:phage gp29-like protein
MNNDLKIQTLSRIYDLAFKRISVKQIELIEKKKIEFIFSEMLNDYHIYAVLQQRKSAVLKRNLNIKYSGQNKELEELIKFVINYSDGFFSALSSLLDAVATGYSVVQLYWDEVEFNNRKVIIPVRFEPNPFYWYKIENNKVFFIDDYGKEIEVIDGKVIIHKNFQDAYFPSGVPLLVKAWFPYFIKKNIPKQILLYIESFVMPTVFARYEGNLSFEEQQKILDMLVNLQDIRAGIFTKNVEIDTLETKTSKTEDFLNVITWCENAISKVFLGGTLTAQLSDVGSYSASKVHYEVREEIAYFDAKNLAETLNTQLISKIIDFNFSESEIDEYPELEFDFSKVYGVDEIVKLIQSQIPLKKSWLYQQLGIPEPSEDDILEIIQFSENENFRI